MPYILYPFIPNARKNDIYFIFVIKSDTMLFVKKILFAFFIGNICVAFSHAESLLTAQQFPKTFEDLSFNDRLEVLTDGYEPYAAEYDDNGFCIKNCAYPGINIKQEEYITEQDTKEALQKSEQFQQSQQQSTIFSNDATTTIVNSISTVNTCSDRNPDVPIGQKVPWSEPLKGNPRITSPFGPRGSGYHDGIDYSAKIGTHVYAPANGRVIAVGNSGRCGNMVQIKHEDGITTIYCHLSKIHVKKNQMIEAGCFFAETGNTGHSTGPHLHYAMRNAQGKKINPASYTKRGSN